MKKSFLTICLLTFLVAISAQDINTPLFKVGNDAVTAAEFIKTFNKNNSFSKATESELREYLDLYISFKLKVRDGIDSKIDTTSSFQAELAAYKKQSAQPYMIDKVVTEQLIKEAIERSKFMVLASHILIFCDADATPKDTLATYQKALDIRKKILSGDISFSDAAVEFSEDPSARDEVTKTGRIRRGNKGDLEYFTAFDLIYPFETTAYNTPVGEHSMPVRSKFGYHIIWVHDKTPYVSNVEISQISLLDTAARHGRISPNVKEKLDLIEKAINSGEDFGSIAEKFTDDPSSKTNGGKVDPFTPTRGRLPGSYVKQVIALEKEQISKPISSAIGWHIVKLDEITKPEFKDEELRLNVIPKVQKDSRSSKSIESFVTKLKKEYKYSEKGKDAAFKSLLKEINKINEIPEENQLLAIPEIKKLKPLAKYANQTITAKEFIHFLNRFTGIDLNHQAGKFLAEYFDNYAKEHVLKYELEHLETKYPEYQELVNEYHHGMILFEMNNERIWSESLRDTAQMEIFYENNKRLYSDAHGNPKPFKEVKSTVLTDFQNDMEIKWLNGLKKRYPVWINEDLFKAIVKNK
jgi:peptidyl-prolyl cis-trans isomerase SurA